MIENGILQFCNFKTNSTVMKNVTQIHDSDRHICPIGQMYCIRRKKISKVSNLTSFNRGALKSQ